jgi:molybdopterin/thiamine biosynthesis adenylyltransferase
MQVVGADAQVLLGAARVLVIGAGGLAAPVLPLLAGAGVGAITLLDPDAVALSNLHRQTLFTEADVGQSKATVACARVRALNRAVRITAWPEAFTPDTGPALIAAHDLVLDCADSYAASYLASDLCLAAGTPLISASVLGHGGYVGGFCGGAPSLRAVFPDAPDSGASCATAGVLGPVVAQIGAMLAQMALQVLMRLEPSPLGTLVQIDTRGWHHARMTFHAAPEPARAFAFVTPCDADLIVDLRTLAEAPTPIHPRALRAVPDTPDTRRLVLACATGLRAWRTAETLSITWPGEIALAAATTTQKGSTP